MAKGAWLPKIFRASWPGICNQCGTSYSKDEVIILSGSAGARKKYHYGCFAGDFKDMYNNRHFKIGGSMQDTCPTEYLTTISYPENEDNTPLETPEVTALETTALETTSADAAIQALAAVIAQPISQRLGDLSKIEDKVNALVAETEGKIKDVIANMPALTESAVEYAVKKYTAVRIEVKTPEATEYRDLGVQHELFPDLLHLSNVRMPDGHRLNIWLAGPGGSGKTKAVEMVATALGLPFYFEGAIVDQYRLSGYSDAAGRYVPTLFRKAYEHGGVFLQDECDGSDPSATLWLNAALANGHCAFPDAVIPKHKDCIIFAAANTWGHGATDNYVGRNKLDGAFLDRFVKLPWHVDEKLERSIAANDAWVDRVQSVRRRVAEKGIKVLVTPRASIYGAQLLASGLPFAKVETLVLRSGMTDAQWSSVQ